MCGRYTIIVTLDELMLRYMIGDTNVPFRQPRYNVAPGQMIFAVIHDGKRNRLGELKWGHVPSWADDPKIGGRMLNARAETLWDKPSFRQLISRKRCLIPADGFYEWRRTDSGKQPMRIVLRSRELFSMAGLYDTWVDRDGTKLSTCTIVTTSPNELMGTIHDRMPVILKPEDEPLWLNRTMDSRQRIGELLRPYPAAEMEAYPVTTAVGNAAADGPDCVEPLGPSETADTAKAK